MNNITTILFDLGRVLIDLEGPPIRNEWLTTPITDAESWRRWIASTYARDFESGLISADDFAAGVIKEQDLIISAAEFTKAYSAWPKALFPGAAEVLIDLRARYTLAFYSNTNELHLPRLMKGLALEDYFDYCFASYQIGFFKPDIAGYQYVVERMQVPAQHILFIDDLAANVAAARAIGMLAEQAEGFAQVLGVLKATGCL